MRERSFEELSALLRDLISIDLNDCKWRRRDLPRTIYALIAKIQLFNGCKLPEAVEAFMKYCESGDEVVKVRTKRKGEEFRTVAIPFSIRLCLRKALFARIKTTGMRKLLWNIRLFFYNKGIRTHSFRHAFIKEMADRGYPINFISKMIKHSSSKELRRRVREKDPDEVLIDFVREWKMREEGMIYGKRVLIYDKGCGRYEVFIGTVDDGEGSTLYEGLGRFNEEEIRAIRKVLNALSK